MSSTSVVSSKSSVSYESSTVSMSSQMTQSYKSESQITTSSSSQESGHSHFPSWSHTEDPPSENKPGLLGGVFHVVSANGRLIRMRMDNTGKIIYDKTVSSLHQLSKLR